MPVFFFDRRVDILNWVAFCVHLHFFGDMKLE